MTIVNGNSSEKKATLEVAVKKSSLDPQDLSNVKGIGKTVKERFIAIGITTIEQLAHANSETLAECKGFGIALAEKLIQNARQFLERQAQTQLNNFTTPNIQRQIIDNIPPTEPPINYILEPVLEKESRAPQSVETLQMPQKSPLNIDQKADAKNVTMEEKEESLSEEEIDREYGFETAEEDLKQGKGEEGAEIGEDLGEEEMIESTQQSEVKHDTVLPDGSTILPSPMHKYENGIKSVASEHKVESDENFSTPHYPDSESINSYFQEKKKAPSSIMVDSELIDKTSIPPFLKRIEQTLRELRYTVILPNNLSFLKPHQDKIDLVGIKVLKVKESVSLIVIIPIKFSPLKGTMVISEYDFDYIPSQSSFQGTERYQTSLKESILDPFYNVSQDLFHDFLFEGALYAFCKKLTNNTLKVQKSFFKKSLYFYANHIQYKVAIDPVVICEKETVCAEKSLKFPYQRPTNIHLVTSAHLTDFIAFLEEKHSCKESTHLVENDIIEYAEAKIQLWKECERSSLFFIGFGFVYLTLILGQFYTMLPSFTPLGIGVLSLYGVILMALMYRFFKVERSLSTNLSTPSYFIPPKLEEADITLMQGQVTHSYLIQLIYEWFGKNDYYESLVETTNSLGAVTEREKEGTKEEKQALPEKRESSIDTKYKSFVED